MNTNTNATINANAAKNTEEKEIEMEMKKEMEMEEYIVDVFDINCRISCCPLSALGGIAYEKNYVLTVAEKLFCNIINEKIIKKYYDDGFNSWSCWEVGAIALVATNIQQRFPQFKFKRLVHYCEYDQLIKLAGELTNEDDVKTLLHVCNSKEEHKKFFNVVKESYEHNEGIVPFFGFIEENEEKLGQMKVFELRKEDIGEEEYNKILQEFKNIERKMFISKILKTAAVIAAVGFLICILLFFMK